MAAPALTVDLADPSTALAEILADILDVEQVSVDSHFFERSAC